MEVIQGDLLAALKNGEIDYAVHCCNGQGVMSSGIAKQVKQKYPNTFAAYKRNHEFYTASRSSVLGTISYDERDCIFNLVGQENYGREKRQGHYGYIAVGLNEIVESILLNHNDEYHAGITIGLPYRFASDRAGCNWTIIQELIEAIIGSHFTVKIYKLH
jgi:hypothetical protein